MKDIIRSHELEMDTADAQLLRKAAKTNHKKLMETAYELGVAEGALEVQTETINALKSKINNFKVSLLAEEDEKNSFEAKFRTEQNAKLSLEIANSSLRKKVLAEQDARKQEVKKASDAAEKVKSAESSVERLSKNLVDERQRAKEAERACREKDDTIRSLEQELEEKDSELDTERTKLEDATERIESLQKELKSQQDKLEAAQSQVQMLEHKLETAEKALQTLQAEFGTFKTQMDKNAKELRAELVAGMRDSEAQSAQKMQDFEAKMMKAIQVQMDMNSATEQKCTDLEQELSTEQASKVVVLKELAASKRTEKLAHNRAQQKEQKLEQQIKDIEASQKAKLDELSQQAASEKEKLQKELTKAKESEQASQEQRKSDGNALTDLQSKVRMVELQNQDLEGQLKTAKTKASEFERKYSKADADVSSLRTVLADAEQKTQTQTNNILALSKEKTAAEKRCAKLELDIKTAEAGMKDQQDDHSELIVEHKKQLDHATKHANKLQKGLEEQLKSAHAQVKRKDSEASRARIEHATLTEKSNQIHQKQIDQAASQKQVLMVELKDCQQKLGLAIQEKDIAVVRFNCLEELRDEERDGGVREWAEYVQQAKDAMKANQEECERRCKDAEDRLASSATAASLETGVFDEDGGIQNAENDASGRVQRHDSCNDDESDSAKEQPTTRDRRSGKERKTRELVVCLQKDLENAQDHVVSLQNQVNAARESTRPVNRSERPTKRPEQQPQAASTSNPQGLPTVGPAQPPQQQAHGQNSEQRQEIDPAEAAKDILSLIQGPQQQAPAQSLQPAPTTIQPPHQQVQGLSGSRWQDQPLQQQAHGQDSQQRQAVNPAKAIMSLLQGPQQQAPAQSLQPAPTTIEPPQQQVQGLSGSKWQNQPDLPVEPSQKRGYRKRDLQRERLQFRG